MSFLNQLKTLDFGSLFRSFAAYWSDDDRRPYAIAATATVGILSLYSLGCMYGNWYFNGKYLQRNLNQSCLEKGTNKQFTEEQNAWAIVTGVSKNGIGYDTALGLAQAGLNVIIATRNPDRAQAAIKQLETDYSKLKKSKPAQFKFMELNLTSPKSVHTFVDEVKIFFADDDAQDIGGGRKLCILCNNAAVMDLECGYVNVKSKQDDIDCIKMEKNWCVNYFMTVMLTEKLFDLIMRHSGQLEFGRIVHVSSMAHNLATKESFDMLTDDLMDRDNLIKDWSTHPYMTSFTSRDRSYGDTKAAVILHAEYLSSVKDKTKTTEHPLKVCSAHPGFGASQLVYNSNLSLSSMGKTIMVKLMDPMRISCAVAARTQLHCCLAKNDDTTVISGAYHYDATHHLTGRHSKAARQIIEKEMQDKKFVKRSLEYINRHFDLAE